MFTVLLMKIPVPLYYAKSTS